MVIREAWAHLRIANPAVAWLCARGEMVSAPQTHLQAMGFWLMGSLAAEASSGQRTAHFADELELAQQRATNHPTAVSRLREEAYEVVRQTWPRSMALLDISRIAAELGEDLGLIAPMVHSVGSDLRVDFHLDMAEANDPDLLQRLSAYEGPRNYTPNPDLVLPDLQAQGFVVAGGAATGGTGLR